MSAPTKCDRCEAKGTFAIVMPCVMHCGGTMHYDKTPAPPAPSGIPAVDLSEASRLDEAMTLLRELSVVICDTHCERCDIDECTRRTMHCKACRDISAFLEKGGRESP